MAKLQKGTLVECPVCGGEDIRGEDWESDGDYAWRIIFCPDCEYEYNEVYKFYQNETIDAEALTHGIIADERINRGVKL